MRFGGPVFDKHGDPDQWIAAVRRLGYSAAYCPVDEHASPDVVSAYATAAERAGVIIAEVGAWSNPLSPDAATSRAALTFCQERLALADAIGACCCVNIAGARGDQEAGSFTGAGWDSPHADNLTEQTFDLLVESVRAIIDAVKPTRTFYTLETMPWMYPDSVDAYLRLIHAIDRPRFAVHLDVVNLICSPQLFYGHRALIRECVEKLGPYVKSCHVKDIALSRRLTVHLDEVRLGTGGLDFGTYLHEMAKLDKDVPLMLEHLDSADEFAHAAEHLRAVASTTGVNLL